MVSIYEETLKRNMHVGPSDSLEAIQPPYQRHGIAIWSKVHDGHRLLIFKEAPHRPHTFCVLYAEPFLLLSDAKIGRFIVELIGIKNSDDKRKHYVMRGKALREILSKADDSQVVYMYFQLFYGRKEMTPPLVQFM